MKCEQKRLSYHRLSHAWPARWNTRAKKPQGSCPCRGAWSVRGTETEQVGQTGWIMDEPQFHRTYPGIRATGRKMDYTHATSRENWTVIHSSCSEAASNLTNTTEKINIKSNKENKACAKLMVSQCQWFTQHHKLDDLSFQFMNLLNSTTRVFIQQLLIRSLLYGRHYTE